MNVFALTRTHFSAWWHCRRRLEGVVSKLKRAGVHQQDPMYPLILEMAVVPDRMLRVLVATFLIALTVTCLVVGVVYLASAYDHVSVYRQSHGDLVLIRTPGGAKSVPCPPEFVCLLIPRS